MESFTYAVSHDPKSPPRGIDGYSRLLRDTYGQELPPEARNFLDNIRKSASMMQNLIDDLLNYSRWIRRISR